VATLAVRVLKTPGGSLWLLCLRDFEDTGRESVALWAGTVFKTPGGSPVPRRSGIAVPGGKGF